MGIWFKPGYKYIHLVRDVNAPWNMGNGGAICPEEYRAKYPETFIEEPVGVMHKGMVTIKLCNAGKTETYYVSSQLLVSI